MQEKIAERLKTVTLGSPQSYMNVSIFPFTNGSPGAIEYMTLGQALEVHQLVVTEIDKDGSVPELKVTNKAEKPILLLDGEELAGAKQNRVLNTTILVPEMQSVVIPVSCTEQGRWSYASETFSDSGTVMERGIRARKNRSVSESLETAASFRSDQGEVWDGIADLQQEAGAASETGAMRDIFEAQSASLEEAVVAFALVTGQIGLLAVIAGRAVGFDLISSPHAYERLHNKLIKSYVMDALVRRAQVPKSSTGDLEAAQGFLDRAGACEEKIFESVGYGEDLRYKGAQLAGSALFHEGTVIHTAFFHLDEGIRDGHMSGINRRSAYRAR